MGVAYSEQGKAQHYNKTSIEAIVVLERTFGTEAAMLFCEMTAMKYRLRIGEKDNPELELKKIKWYERSAKEYRRRLNLNHEIVINNRDTYELNIAD